MLLKHVEVNGPNTLFKTKGTVMKRQTQIEQNLLYVAFEVMFKNENGRKDKGYYATNMPIYDTENPERHIQVGDHVNILLDDYEIKGVEKTNERNA